MIAGAFFLQFSGQSAVAASASWNVDAAGSWPTDSNWNPTTAPGSTSGSSITDVATFSKTLTADRMVTVDANRNIGGISFSNTSAFKITLSGGNLLLTNGGVIQSLVGNGNHTDCISTALSIQGDGGAACVTAGASSASSLLSVAAITGVSSGSNVTTLTLNGANGGANIVAGIVSDGTGGGKLAIQKSDSGKWILAGNNTYTGPTTISSGTLQLGNGGATGSLSPGSALTDNGTLAFSRTGTVTQGTDFASVISGTGNLVLVGSGTLVFSGTAPNTYSGMTWVNGGTLFLQKTAGVAAIAGNITVGDGSGSDILQLGASDQIADTSIISLTGTVTNQRGMFRLNGYNETIGGLSSTSTGAGVVENFGVVDSTLTLNVLSGTQTFSGLIRNFGAGGPNSLAIQKSGPGTQVLSGVNTYSGNTTISGGTLALSGSGSIAASANIIVAGGATFDVSGLSSAFTLSGSQTLSNSSGGAAISGTINCASGTVSLNFDGANPAFIVTNGAMTISGSTILKITTSGSSALAGTYKIISKGSGGTGGLVSGTAPGSVTVVSGSNTGTYSLSISGGELYLNAMPSHHSIVVMGSSVAQGYGSDSSLTTPTTTICGSDLDGYAGLLTSLLLPEGWAMNNISIGGQNTQNGLNRFSTDLVPLSPDYVWLGYSLANEGLHGSTNPASVVATFTNNLSALITQCRSNGFYPLIGLNYPSNPYTASEYESLKATNLAMNTWNVPSANFLGALDDGHGHWVSGYYYNDTHPNHYGHQELFYAIVPSLFDAIAAGKNSSPHFGDPTRFARLTQNLNVTAPLSFTPANAMHSLTMSFRVHSTNNGTIAAIRTGTSYATLEIRGGQLVYCSPGGGEVPASVSVADGQWHDVALASRYALQQTALMVDGMLVGTMAEQYVPDQFTLGGASGASGHPPTPAVVDFQNWCVYRSAWNINEAVAQLQGSLQQASMEICAALDDGAFTTGSSAFNCAQSLSVAMVNTPNLLACQDVAAPSNLSAQALQGSSAGLTWTRNSNSETGFVIERRVSGTNVSGTNLWSDLVFLPPGSITYTDSGLAVGVSYDYRVAALEGGLRANYSNTATVVTGLGVHQTILIDFGPNDVVNGASTTSPDYLGQYWNNMTSVGSGTSAVASTAPSGAGLAQLITTTNVSTPIGLTLTSAWSANGIASGGLLAPSYSLLGNFAVSNATEDYFFTTTSASLNLTNLDPTLNYRLRFFGTRSATDSRVSTYTVTGGNGAFTTNLATSGSGIGSGGYNGNNNTIASIGGVTPNASSQIQLVMSNSTPGSFAAYLGILELLANHSPSANALVYSATVGQTLSVDVINGPNAPTDADGDGLTVTAVSGSLVGGGTAATNGGTGFTYSATVAGTNQFSYTVSDPYGGTCNNTVTVIVSQGSYDSWVAAWGLAGADFNGNFNGDGISNGMKYALGVDPRGFFASPTPVRSGSNYLLSYPKGREAANDPKILYGFEESTDLIQWTEVAPTYEDNTVVSITLSGGEARKFVRLKIKRLP